MQSIRQYNKTRYSFLQVQLRECLMLLSAVVNSLCFKACQTWGECTLGLLSIIFSSGTYRESRRLYPHGCRDKHTYKKNLFISCSCRHLHNTHTYYLITYKHFVPVIPAPAQPSQESSQLFNDSSFKKTNSKSVSSQLWDEPADAVQCLLLCLVACSMPTTCAITTS